MSKIKSKSIKVIKQLIGFDDLKIQKVLNSGQFKSVSFDVFDTLIYRKCIDAETILQIVKNNYERRFNKTIDFIHMRKYAEAIARKNCDEVTLTEIYSYIDCPAEEKEWLFNEEIAVEEANAIQNKYMKRIYDSCIENNIPVYIISDMYLSKKVIKNILIKNEYSVWKSLIVSSECHKTKASGALYREFVQEQSIDCRHHVHIGDALVSDYLSAKKNGMKAYLYMETSNTYLRNKLFSSDKYLTLHRFFNITETNYCYNEFEQMGYEVLGPILFVFSDWLQKKCKENDTDKLLFLTREGYLLKRAFEIVDGGLIKSDILTVSRRAVLYQYLANATSIEEIGEIMHISLKKFTVGQLINYLGISESDINSFDNNIRIDELSRLDKERLFHLMRTEMVQISEKQKRLLIEYLQASFSKKLNGIVDVGWHGTIQDAISDLMREYKIIGYYMGDDNKEKHPEQEALFFSCDKNPIYQNCIMATGGLFELLFLSTDGSLIRYKKNGKEISFIKSVCEHDENEKMIINGIQSAALQFVKDYKEASENGIKALDVELAMNNYMQMVNNYKTILCFKNICYENATVSKLLPEKRLSYYVTHLSEMKLDFCNSSCKGLFLKTIIPLPIHYYNILGALRRWR